MAINDAYFTETFAAVGLCEYYLATGREDLKRKMEQYFDIAYALYKESLAKMATGDEAIPLTKALGPSMILLSTAQILRKVDKEKYGAVAAECADEIIRHFIEGKGLLENVGMNSEFIDSARGREINPGHSLEAAWFLLAEGIYSKNDEYKSVANKIIDVSMSLGYRDGGIIAFCDCHGDPPSQLEWDMKIW